MFNFIVNAGAIHAVYDLIYIYDYMLLPLCLFAKLRILVHISKKYISAQGIIAEDII